MAVGFWLLAVGGIDAIDKIDGIDNRKAVTPRFKHKGGVSGPGLRVKTLIFEMDDAIEGYADAEVNEFCATHEATAIVLDRYNDKMIYRILYKEENDED